MWEAGDSISLSLTKILGGSKEWKLWTDFGGGVGSMLSLAGQVEEDPGRGQGLCLWREALTGSYSTMTHSLESWRPRTVL